MVERIFGTDPVAGGSNDLMALVSQSDPGALPALRLWCGDRDILLADTLRFRDTCATAGLSVEAVVSPGEHEWGYWDAKI